MPNGLLQQTFDSRNQRYDLPPFVINPPLRYGTKAESQDQVNIEKQRIKVTFRSTKYNDCVLDVETTETTKQVKDKLTSNLKENRKIRLFYGGKELHDIDQLGRYNIKDKYIIQVFFSE